MALLSYGDKAGLICSLYKAGDRHVWDGNVPGKGEEVLRLRRAALDAVTFRCTEPACDHDARKLPRDADGLPIEIEDEGEPPGLEQRRRRNRGVRHLRLART